jgi:hypothetical protein
MKMNFVVTKHYSKILIDRNMKFEKELSRYQIIENGM